MTLTQEKIDSMNTLKAITLAIEHLAKDYKLKKHQDIKKGIREVLDILMKKSLEINRMALDLPTSTTP